MCSRPEDCRWSMSQGLPVEHAPRVVAGARDEDSLFGEEERSRSTGSNLGADSGEGSREQVSLRNNMDLWSPEGVPKGGILACTSAESGYPTSNSAERAICRGVPAAHSRRSQGKEQQDE
jgi:hypothetical protein